MLEMETEEERTREWRRVVRVRGKKRVFGVREQSRCVVERERARLRANLAAVMTASEIQAQDRKSVV